MLIMGGAKAREIGQTPILNWYAQVFEDYLSQQPSRIAAYRNEIARALSLSARILIMNEPTSALTLSAIFPRMEYMTRFISASYEIMATRRTIAG